MAQNPQKKHPPPSILAKRFLISNWILADWSQQSDNAKILRFLYGNEIFLYYSPQIYYFKKRVSTKIICATIPRQINLIGHNLLRPIFFSTYLLACYLLTGLYNFYSRPKCCKVYLYSFVAPLALFLCSLLSYLS